MILTLTILFVWTINGIAQVLTVTPSGTIDSYFFNSQILTANPSGATSYDWYGIGYYYCGAPDQLITSGQTFLPAQGSYYCVATWANGSTSVSNSVIIRELINVFPPNYSGSYNHACQSQGKPLIMQPNSFTNCIPPFWDSYQWKLNGINIPGATTFDHLAIQSGDYSCEVSSTAGSVVSPAVYIRIDQPIPATATITVDTLCGILTVPYFEGAAYQWFVNNVQLYSSTATSPVYRNTPCYNGTYKCRITNDCGVYYTPTIYTDFCVQSEYATVSSSGPTSFCSGGSVTLTLNSAPNKTVQWWNGNQIIPGATAYSYNATTSGGYYAILTNQNGCSIVATGVNVNANAPYANISPGGAVSFCPGDSVTLTASSGPGYTYQWKKDTVTISGATGNTYKAKTSGAYTIRVTAPCGTATSEPLNVYTNGPNAAVTISGSTTLCPGDSVTLQALPGYSSYQWSKAGVAIAGATSPSYTVNYVNGGGYYRVTITGVCGTKGSNLIDVLLVSPLTANLYVVGTDQLCTGQSTVLTATGNPSATAFKWKKNNSNISGAKSSAYRVTQPGTYKVEVTGTCGTAVSSPVTINVNSSMPAVVYAGGPTVFCQGDSVSLVANTGIGLSYKWKKNNSLISGATTANYLAVSTGNYKVQVTNPYGCSGTSSASAVTVYGLPIAYVTAQGPTTFCNGDSVELKTSFNSSYSYKWKRNNVNILNALSNKYYAKTQGFYKVKVTNANGCTKISNAISVTVPCRDGYFDKEYLPFELSPNPSSFNFTLHLNSTTPEKYLFFLYDVAGRLIAEERINANQNDYLFGADLKPGVYLIKIKINENYYQQRIIKTE